MQSGYGWIFTSLAAFYNLWTLLISFLTRIILIYGKGLAVQGVGR